VLLICQKVDFVNGSFKITNRKDQVLCLKFLGLWRFEEISWKEKT
jgi:hypothetical protein